jgi:hypothetical protein
VNTYKLSIIQETFSRCLRDTALFSRAVVGNHLFEVNNVRKDMKQWVVLAAGLNDFDAAQFFKDNPSRALRAKEPLTITQTGCKVSALFILSSFEENTVAYDKIDRIAPFAPGNAVPFVEVRAAKLKVEGIPDNELGIANLRWDFDLMSSFNPPMEKWAQPWQKICGFNPTHAASHFHINSSEDEHVSGPERPGDNILDLRIATGLPNPLALVISLSTWLSSLSR